MYIEELKTSQSNSLLYASLCAMNPLFSLCDWVNKWVNACVSEYVYEHSNRQRHICWTDYRFRENRRFFSFLAVYTNTSKLDWILLILLALLMPMISFWLFKAKPNRTKQKQKLTVSNWSEWMCLRNKVKEIWRERSPLSWVEWWNLKKRNRIRMILHFQFKNICKYWLETSNRTYQMFSLFG